MLKYLLEKEFKQFFRNPFLPKLMIGLPLMALLIFPLVADMEVKNIHLGVIDHDQSPYSQKLVQQIQSSGYFIVEDRSESYQESLAEMDKGNVDVIIEIPAGFEKSMIRESHSKVMIVANTVNIMVGGMGSAYLANMVNNFSIDIRNEWIQTGMRLTTPSFSVIPQYRFNPSLKYKVSMIPALMMMILAIFSGFIPAVNIVIEKEDGTIEQMNVTPIKKRYFILSKLIPFWIVGFVVLGISMLVALIVYNMVPVGNLLTFLVFATFFILGFSGFGLVISNYAKTMQQSIFMIFFFVITFVFISGLYTPIANMPQWAQTISMFSPLRYMAEVLRLVYLKGSGFGEMIPQLVALSSFAVVFNAWAILSYRKNN